MSLDSNILNYLLVTFIFGALVVMVWLWQRLSSATGKLDSEIDGLRKWQEQHRPMEKRMQFLDLSFQMLPMGVVTIDPQLKVSYVNQTAQNLLDLKSTNFLEKPYQEVLKFLHEDGSSVYGKSDLVLGLFESRQPLERQHYQIKAGQATVPVDVTWKPMIDADNTVLGAIAVIQDNTHQKQLEEMKVDFVSIVSHELRTPITAIKGYIDILLHETHLDPEHAEMLRRVYMSNERQLETVESMLNLSRLERGTIPIHPEAFHIEELVGQVVGEVEPLARQKGLEIKFDYPRFATPTVWADPARTREVILNLCTNGIKYTDQGTIRVALSQQGKQMNVTVTDSGPGIPPDVLGKLFEKFQRGESALTEQKQGMGLGLYISKQFVELMGGQIGCQSQVGQGSTFYFSLPIK